MDFKERLKLARKRAKITQEQLAYLCDCSKGAVSQWESGTTVPELGTFVSICRALNASADFLLFGKEEIAIPAESLALANKIFSMSEESREQLASLFKTPADDGRVSQSYSKPNKRHI